MNFAELVLNPVRLRVLQRIRLEGECTAKDIAIALEDIPRATVYRQIKALEEGVRLWRDRIAPPAVQPCGMSAPAVGVARLLPRGHAFSGRDGGPLSQGHAARQRPDAPNDVPDLHGRVPSQGIHRALQRPHRMLVWREGDALREGVGSGRRLPRAALQGA